MPKASPIGSCFTSLARRLGPNTGHSPNVAGRSCWKQSYSPSIHCPSSLPPRLRRLIAELVKRGVTEAVATDLVGQHQAEAIRASDRNPRLADGEETGQGCRPGAYLVSAIKTGHAAPRGFTTKAERQAREEAHQARQRQAGEARRQEQEQKARDRDTRQKVDAYLKQLGQAGRIALEAEVLAAASPADREHYESHSWPGSAIR